MPITRHATAPTAYRSLGYENRNIHSCLICAIPPRVCFSLNNGCWENGRSNPWETDLLTRRVHNTDFRKDHIMATSGITQQIEQKASPRLQQPQAVSIRPPFWLRMLRRNSYVYSVMCKSQLFYSRHLLAANERSEFRGYRELFSMNEFEAQRVQELKQQGFTVLPEFFPASLVDNIFEKADRMYREL